MIEIYGSKIEDAPPESAEMITFFNWIRREHPELAAIAVHIRNEGKRTHQQTSRQKLEGMTTGAADIIIPGAPTFVCEMKRRARYRVTNGQREYLEASQRNGAFACGALGCDGAKEAFADWIKINQRTGRQIIKVYGSKIKDAPTESAEMITFFNWIRREYPELAEIAVHIRNEGKRTHQQTARQKLEGFVTGAADIIIPGAPTFVCEMKRRARYRVTNGQRDYLEASQRNGAFACGALGYDGAKEAFADWIKISLTCVKL